MRTERMEEIEIRAFPIELYKVLQIAGWLDTGGMAKLLIAEGEVRVNGEIELRKRRKCVEADVIEFSNERGVLTALKPDTNNETQ